MLPLLALFLFAAPPTEKLPLGENHAILWRTHSLSSGSHTGIERAFILLHGTNRNADDYFHWALAATAAASANNSTVVIAPHFKARTREERGDAVEPNEIYFTNEGWKAGEAALNSPLTSFDVFDRLLAALSDTHRFPDLKEIVVTGHSAGGQFVQRYAAVSRFEPPAHLSVRYVVANPSSYLYLNDLRIRQGASCSERGECSGAFVRYWDARNCTTFNNYRYGLGELSGYSATVPVETIREQYVRRKITYLVGELDTRTDDPNLDKSCPAVAQGAFRRERGTIFWNYMKSQFRAQHEFAIAPGCGHSAVCVFAGPAGVKAVFGK